MPCSLPCCGVFCLPVSICCCTLMVSEALPSSLSLSHANLSPTQFVFYGFLSTGTQTMEIGDTRHETKHYADTALYTAITYVVWVIVCQTWPTGTRARLHETPAPSPLSPQTNNPPTTTTKNAHRFILLSIGCIFGGKKDGRGYMDQVPDEDPDATEPLFSDPHPGYESTNKGIISSSMADGVL